MKSMSTLRYVSLLLAALLLATAVLPLPAKPMTFGEQKGHLSVPDDWNIKQMSSGASGYAAAATNPTQTESISIFVVSTQSTGSLSDDSEYVKGFLKSCTDHNANVVGREHRTVNGTDFYILSVTQKLISLELNSQVWLGIGNGHIYQIAFYEKNGDPAKNADYSSVIQSFSLAGN